MVKQCRYIKAYPRKPIMIRPCPKTLHQLQAYRSAGSDEKKIALKVLKGEYGDKVTSLLNLAGGSVSGAAADGISDAIGSLLSGLLGGK